ncbi:hypothetical protein [Clostridium tagluense]|uniref:hypothetical protein n=1 Tax=Clostridium tagluense TaxID=360422 RepID=UPI001CF5394D|nr:hypothetical protein [Clostridium tagluense]MCB2298890.1 hypothetical protein [Clostridium tagluense]
MDTIEGIDDLINQMESEVRNGITINISEEKNNRYKQWTTYVNSQKAILSKDKFKYVFIGQKGIGKTSTILELFKLINNGTELLSTGSGGTTVCEVEIKKSEEQYSYFEIIPIDDKYMSQYVYDFCSTFRKDDSNATLYVPTEIARSLRNMLGMKKNEIDELCAKFIDFNSFVGEVNIKLELDNRNETIIKCEPDKDGSFFSDVEKKFNNINLGKVKNSKIPQKINLYLTKDIIDFDTKDSVLSIVDTRGIESDLSKNSEIGKSDSFKREDILNYIDKEQKDCIYLFIDGIKPAPSQGILNTLKSRITKENVDKFYLLINIYNDEAEKVMTDDGTAKSIDVGVSFKKEDILFKFKQENILFNEDNLIFYNSKNNYPDNKTILRRIEDNFIAEKQKSYKECESVKIAFEKLKYNFEDKDYAIKNFEKLYELIKDVTVPKNLLNEIIEDFVNNEMHRLHSKRLDAINRNYGDYYAYDFYYHFSIIIEETFDRIYRDSKNNVIEKVTEFLGYKNITQLDEIDYKIYLEKLEKDYLKQRDDLKSHFRICLEKEFKLASWESAKREYGNGGGYTGRVCEIYKNEIESLNSTNNYKQSFDEKWAKIVKDNCLGK